MTTDSMRAREALQDWLDMTENYNWETPATIDDLRGLVEVLLEAITPMADNEALRRMAGEAVAVVKEHPEPFVDEELKK